MKFGPRCELDWDAIGDSLVVLGQKFGPRCEVGMLLAICRRYTVDNSKMPSRCEKIREIDETEGVKTGEIKGDTLSTMPLGPGKQMPLARRKIFTVRFEFQLAFGSFPLL